MIEYTLYTLPNCSKCSDIKKILEENNIPYKEVSLGNIEGKRDLGKIYLQIIKDLEKDEKTKQPLLPILVKKNESVIKVANIADKVREILGE